MYIVMDITRALYHHNKMYHVFICTELPSTIPYTSYTSYAMRKSMAIASFQCSPPIIVQLVGSSEVDGPNAEQLLDVQRSCEGDRLHAHT